MNDENIVTENRLLIIDDNPHFGELIGTIAETADFAVVATQGLEEFFRQLDLFRPHVVTVDLVMPEIDGIELLRELALLGCEAKILVTSGVDDRILAAAETLGREMGLQIAGVISKPIRAAELRAKLQSLKAAS